MVAENPAKKHFFPTRSGWKWSRRRWPATREIEVISYRGLIVNCLREHKATVLIRGMRAISDFEYEFQMAFTNRNMLSGAETVFLMPSAKYVYLNSTMVKEIAKLGGDVTPFVPECVRARFRMKYPAA